MRVIKEIIYFVHAGAALLALFLLFSLTPGDNVNTSVSGALLGIVLVGVADALVTVPLSLFARALGSRRTASPWRR